MPHYFKTKIFEIGLHYDSKIRNLQKPIFSKSAIRYHYFCDVNSFLQGILHSNRSRTSPSTICHPNKVKIWTEVVAWLIWVKISMYNIDVKSVNLVRFTAVLFFSVFWRPYLGDKLYLALILICLSVICPVKMCWHHGKNDTESTIFKKWTFVNSLFRNRNVIRFQKFWSWNN